MSSSAGEIPMGVNVEVEPTVTGVAMTVVDRNVGVWRCVVMSTGVLSEKRGGCWVGV